MDSYTRPHQDSIDDPILVNAVFDLFAGPGPENGPDSSYALESDDGRRLHIHQFEADDMATSYVTTGISTRPMTPISSVQNPEQFRYAELVMLIRNGWDLGDGSDINQSWPVYALQSFAAKPFFDDTWIWQGHTIPLRRETFGPTGYSAAILLPNQIWPEEYSRIGLPDGREITLLYVVFIYAEEYEYTKKFGMKALIQKFGETGLPPPNIFINPKSRINACI